jgi:hypothetical protein
VKKKYIPYLREILDVPIIVSICLNFATDAGLRELGE